MHATDGLYPANLEAYHARIAITALELSRQQARHSHHGSARRQKLLLISEGGGRDRNALGALQINSCIQSTQKKSIAVKSETASFF